ncbi:MAG: flagellar export chaperone FlgN [Phycisphaerae bacterium]|nr:flagellar export chaperone FlgN [Phycisphaerae bacterium]
MSRQILDIETVMQQLIDEHRKVLAQVVKQREAMKAFNVREMEDIALLQEATRLRIVKLELQRRALVQQIVKLYKLKGTPTISQLSELFPQQRETLFRLRDELREVMGEVRSRTQIAGRVAGSVLGHLNTVVRLLAGVVEKAGTYTKNGVPRVAPRISSMEAVA